MEYINTLTTPEKLYQLCTEPVKRELNKASADKKVDIVKIVNDEISSCLSDGFALTKIGASDIIKRELKNKE